MDATEYQLLAKRTLIDRPNFTLTDEQIMTIWNALGFAGEAGEVAEHIKKAIFHQHGIDYGKVIKELGDALWYAACLCTVLDIDFSEVMFVNIEKLKIRYPAGFTTADSIARVDTKQP